MRIDDLLHQMFASRSPDPSSASTAQPVTYMLPPLISEQSNAWNKAALELARRRSGAFDVPAQSLGRPTGPEHSHADQPARVPASAQEQTLQWNERALARLDRDDLL